MSSAQYVAITGPIPTVARDILEQSGARVAMYTGKKTITRSALLRLVRGADAIIPLLTEKIDGAVMDAAGKNLKIIACYTVGYNNVDLQAAQKRNIVITNTPNTSEPSVAEHTIALMLSLAHRITEADAFARAGKYKGWRPELLVGTLLREKTLGIVGMGRIGYVVAEFAKNLGMQVIYSDVVRNQKAEELLQARYVPLAVLLDDADVVSLHVPLLPSTQHLIGTKQLAAMKKTALLVNTARGPVVDEKALAVALKNKTIAGAALDVFEFEPKITPALKRLPNCILTPHIASATAEARTQMADVATRNVLAVLNGKPALNPVS